MAESATEVTETTETAGTGESTESTESTETVKTFTQDELDAIVENRLARERRKFSDYDDIKSKADKFDQSEAEKLSEIEKANKRAAEVEAELERIKSEARSTALKTAIREAARDKGADPVLALDALQGSASDLLDLDEDGSPTDLAATMDKLLEQRPSLLVAPQPKPTPSADQGARGGQPAGQLTKEDLVNMSPEDIVQARSEGRLNSVLKG